MHLSLGRTVVVVAAALVVAVMAVPPADAKGGPGSGTADGRYIPPTHTEGSTEVMPVTLPEGIELELRYPRRLHLAELGVGVGGAVTWDVRPDPLRCCGRVLDIELMTIAEKYGVAKPIATYPNAQGEPVPYFHANQAVNGGLTTLDYLVFQFGPWMVSVYDHDAGDFEDRMTAMELAGWAQGLRGSVDEHGYLVLETHAPLEGVEPWAVGFLIGEPIADANQVEVSGPRYCDVPGSDTAKKRKFEGGIAWCDEATGSHVRVTGTPKFVRAVSHNLELEIVNT